MSAFTYNEAGILIRWHDDTLYQHHYYDPTTGVELPAPQSPIAYTAQEKTDADARATAQTEATNESTLRSQVSAQIDALKADIGATTDPAGTTSLRAIRNQTNATINSGPAPYIKALTGFLIDDMQATVRISKILVRALTDTTSAPQ